MRPITEPNHAFSGSAQRKTVWDRLFAPVEIDLLVYFRIVFGGVMLYWVVDYCASGFVDEYYIQPRYHFHYFGFGWVKPWPGSWMWWHFSLMGLCAVLIALGCFYRVATVVFAIGFTHLFLIDKTLYLNHYYLVSLVAWTMLVLPAHRAFSLDAVWRPTLRSMTAPAWTLWLVRFQIGLPYFFGGVAKLSADWLAGEPARTMLALRTWYPGIGQFFTEEWCVQAFVWGGMMFDLLVVPALLWQPTRLFAYALALLFHIMNATLFSIGIFPWLMILATLVYFPPDSLRRLLRKDSIGSTALSGLSWSRLTGSRKLLVSLLASYVVVQVLVPLRHHFQDGNPSWTEEGHYFSWHMMLRGKTPAVRLMATDPSTGHSGAVDLRRYVTPYQMQRFGRDPRMIHELCHIVAADLQNMGFADVEIHVLALVSMNGRKPQLMIDPTVDLAAETVGWRQPRWIVPLTEPLRDEPWDMPLLEWEKHVKIPARYQRPPQRRVHDPA